MEQTLIELAESRDNLFKRAEYLSNEYLELVQPLQDKEEREKEPWLVRFRNMVKGDFSSICLLCFLYLLQGIPLGLVQAIPLILQGRKITYSEQAVFSFATWPFSLKLLWAPIVDSLYWRLLGRRKSWMVPCQYVLGIYMVFLSYRVDIALGDDDSKPNVFNLLMMFLPLDFLAATQDIAVDGWALTMLSRKNVGYASTCNAVGQAAGVFLGYVGFMTLESANFANMFRSLENQSDEGFVELSGFIFFWGVVFFITTTGILFFKKEVDLSVEDMEEDEEYQLNVLDTYKILVKILVLPPMFFFIIFLTTGRIAFSATDSMTDLKLISFGVPRERVAGLFAFLIPLQLSLPFMIGKYTAGARPLNIYLMAYPYRICMVGVFAAVVWWTPSFRLPDGTYPMTLYICLICGKCLYEAAVYCVFVSQMAFHAQISDPKIGGTYMTLLNTVSNLGVKWSFTLSLWMGDKLTWKDCVDSTKSFLFDCSNKALADQCTAESGTCQIRVDGYYITVAFCALFGILWYLIMFKRIRYFQRIPRKDWSVVHK